MLVKRSRYYSISEISKEVSKKAEELLKEKDIDKSDEQTQKEWEEDVTSFLGIAQYFIKQSETYRYRCDD